MDEIYPKRRRGQQNLFVKNNGDLLKEYLDTFPNANNPYLFFNTENGALDDYAVNRRLKDLAEDAHIELGNLSLT